MHESSGAFGKGGKILAYYAIWMYNLPMRNFRLRKAGGRM